MTAPILNSNWQALYDLAAAQGGFFTSQQALSAGYSRPLLTHHQKVGRITRIQRGIYRLVHFPPGEHEELVIAWLWAERQGVYSHQTALMLHELSDVMPALVHLTLPQAWHRRRLKAPDGVVLHYADVASDACSWVGPIPVTVPRQTLIDCARAGLSPDLLRQAANEALARGLVARDDIDEVNKALEPFGAIQG